MKKVFGNKKKKYPRYFVYFADGDNRLSKGGYIKIHNKKTHPVHIYGGIEHDCSSNHTEKTFDRWIAEGDSYREVIKEELVLLI